MTPRPLDVAFLDHTTAPGGAELALARTLAHAPADIRPVVVTPSDDPGVFGAVDVAVVGRPQYSGAATARGLGAATRYGVAIAAQAAALRRSPVLRRADVVVANTSRSALYGALAVAGTSTRFVVHLRDEITPAALGPAGFRAMRAALARADAVVANSRHTLAVAAPLLRPGTARHVVASPAGVEVRAPWEPEPAPVRRIGMVARIDPWKGHELLLHAFARAFAGTAVELHVAGGAVFGGSDHADALRALAGRLGVAGQVRWAGHVTDVAGWVDAMDVCVQCSTRPEPLGQNVLQYLARRRPVVASAEGGPAEWVRHGDNGLLVPPRDVDALADALRAVSADWPLRRRVMSSTPVEVPDARTSAEAVFAVLRATRPRTTATGRAVERAAAPSSSARAQPAVAA